MKGFLGILIKVIVTVGLAGAILLTIRHDIMKIRTKILANPLTTSLMTQQQKVKAKARAITLNHHKPSFEDFVAYRVAHGQVGISRNYVIYYERLAEYMPQKAEAHALLGFCYYHTGKHEEAKAAFIRAIQLNPDFFWTPFNLGVIYFYQDRYQEAAVMLRRALALKPEATLKTIFSSKIYGEIIRSAQNFDYAVEENLKAGYRDAYLLLLLTSDQLNKSHRAPPDASRQQILIQFF